ncbi:hypothetical protein [Sansalvadorimonas verongulae]|uniref:hypothetical protein n=1 Tax=Sansalvadorimonas verongulae TaxID=2172824 RepID=UPI0012BC346A|nr:hypothetical protein [Sansalvadorimonas verongulae]MTI12304.1 hypothetical protein [Sansalvadorimonas verongulae]
MSEVDSSAGQQPVKLEVVQSGLLGLRRSLGKVRLLRSFGFNLDFSSFQQMELGQRLRLTFHGGTNSLTEFCGYIVDHQDKGQEHEYSVALEADDGELEEINQLVAAGLATQKASAGQKSWN